MVVEREEVERGESRVVRGRRGWVTVRRKGKRVVIRRMVSIVDCLDGVLFGRGFWDGRARCSYVYSCSCSYTRFALNDEFDELMFVCTAGWSKGLE